MSNFKPDFQICKDVRFCNDKEDTRDEEYGKEIYIKELGPSTIYNEVKKAFEVYGFVLEVILKRKKNSRCYFGIVKMSKRKDAEKAMAGISSRLGWELKYYTNKINEIRSRSRSISTKVNNNNAQAAHENTSNKSGNKSFYIKEKLLANSKYFQPEPSAVRELWIGNLPANITEYRLYNHFFIFGEISQIELLAGNGFAFIKYRLLRSAFLAYQEMSHANIEGKQIKMSFSDCAKRKDIIGDEPGFFISIQNCRLLHCTTKRREYSFSESYYYQQFSRFGKINAFLIKFNIPAVQSIFIEYESCSYAKNVYDYYNNPSPQVASERKLRLGEKVDVEFYFRKRIFGTDVTGIKNELPSHNVSNECFSQCNMINPFFINYPITPVRNHIQNMPYHSYNHYFMNNNPSKSINLHSNDQQNLRFDMNSRNSFNNEYLFHSNIHSASVFNNGVHNYQMPENMELLKSPPNLTNKSVEKKMNAAAESKQSIKFSNKDDKSDRNNKLKNTDSNKINSNKAESWTESKSILNQPNLTINLFGISTLSNFNINEILDAYKYGTDILNTASETNESSIQSKLFKKEYSLCLEKLKLLWSGKLKFQNDLETSVCAYQIRNDCTGQFIGSSYSVSSILDSTDDIFRNQLIGVVAFSPQDETQIKYFEECTSLLNKNIGLISIRPSISIYLVGQSDFSRQFYQNPRKHILGILVNTQVKESNNSFLTPVISIQEKAKYSMSHAENFSSDDESSLNLSFKSMNDNEIRKLLIGLTKSNTDTIRFESDLMSKPKK